MLLAILTTALVTGFITIVFLNLRVGEKQIRHKLVHEWSVEQPQFLGAWEICWGRHPTA
jgi:hypothetical protein